MNSLLVYLIIVFNDKVKIEIPYDSMEACRIAEEGVMSSQVLHTYLKLIREERERRFLLHYLSLKRKTKKYVVGKYFPL